MHKPTVPIQYYREASKQIQFKDGTPYWTKRRAGINIGRPAGNIDNTGYRIIGFSINGKVRRMLAHRLCWFINTGQLPDQLDHVNRDKLDNRFENLRVSNDSANQRNRKARGVSKFNGVSASRRIKKPWKSAIRVAGERVHLGYFAVEKEAAKAYDDACIANGLADVANLNFPLLAK